MRGLMAKPSGEIIETPIISNFKEGLTVLEYFNSTHGARKGLADTALKTANSGYLTRRLVDVAQDCIITEEDCGTEGRHQDARDHRRRPGRGLARRAHPRPHHGRGHHAIRRPARRDRQARHADRRSRMSRRSAPPASRRCSIRSVLTCETTNGVCGKCYGRDLARGTPVNIGEAVGVIAAQSIGEPGTQLTMRTFHIGGTAQIAEQSFIESNFEGTIQIRNRNIARNSDGELIAMARNIAVVDRRPGRHRARGPPHPVRRAPEGRRRRQGQARPAHRRVGSLHPPDPHRGRRHDRASRIWSRASR